MPKTLHLTTTELMRNAGYSPWQIFSGPQGLEMLNQEGLMGDVSIYAGINQKGRGKMLFYGCKAWRQLVHSNSIPYY